MRTEAKSAATHIEGTLFVLGISWSPTGRVTFGLCITAVDALPRTAKV